LYWLGNETRAVKLQMGAKGGRIRPVEPELRFGYSNHIPL
jgi:hypothetical protein